MTSPAEQMFLLGEIIDFEPISGLALFGYADLTAGSAIIFAAITISTYIASDWKVLNPWISALLTAVIRPIRAVVVGISWLLMQLAAVRSLDDVFTTLRNLEDGAKSRIVESRLSRFVSAVVNWYFPFNRPLATVCRLSLSFICGTTTVYGLLLPAAWHVFGLFMAESLPEEELLYYCFDIFGRLEQGRLNRRDWLEVVFCLGQETGLELRAIIRDDWQLPRLIEGEIHYLYVLAFVTTSVLCAILAALSWYTLAKAVPS
ncbi:integral membrane protein [Aspergillus arachidicola]|uniref:Integral membrane protein n=1 Tax=Aspergillus arachidicola TaxID=656916 RepID=A0A2G7GBV6_9EURO|nr:integral membrane protein [Aspergillus arachidicola]